MKVHLFNSVFIITIICLVLSFSFTGCHRNNVSGPEEEIEVQTYFKLNPIRNPRARVTWKPGSTHTIEWRQTDNVAKVKIELTRKFNTVYTISKSTDDDGRFTWTIPPTLQQSHHYRIKLIDVKYPDVIVNSVEFEILQ